MNPLTMLLKGLVYGYRYGISPLMMPSCRYLPTCSDFALEALERRGPLIGSWLSVRRILRCHPLGGSGYDPVPSRPEASVSSIREESARGRANRA